MNINLLSIFITLAETLHFRKTSDHHHITVSTLTRMIQRLEKELKVVLFERNNRYVVLTKQGQVFYNFAKKSVGQYEHLLQDIHPESSDQLRGNITIHSTVTAAYYILPPIIKEFRKQYPWVMTYLETGHVKQGYERLLNHEVDFSIGIMSQKKIKQCLCKKILETPLIFIAPKQVELKTPLDLPMILPKEGELSLIIQRYLKSHGLNVGVHSYVDGHEAILAMVSAGLGSAILPKIVVENSHLSETVVSVKSLSELPNLDVGLFTKKNMTLSPVKQVFWDFVYSNSF
ncbi:MAG: LysR substrate-binding domain-containing protein [Candidatus Margulisiibacteriota bacterium]